MTSTSRDYSELHSLKCLHISKLFSTIFTFIRLWATLSVPSPRVTRGQDRVKEADTTSIIFGIFGFEDQNGLGS